VKGVLKMKLKITEHNGALMVSVLGSRQELVICEEGGGFELELRERESERVWWEEPCEVKVQVFEPVAVPEEAGQVKALASVQEEVHPVTSPVVEPEGNMFKKLAELRREIAYANGLPPYMVFHDKALWEMVEAQPKNLVAFSKISGVGQSKLEKYGERFLAVINGAAA
jgi:superfamily II DNA helicase RecQ